MINFYRFNHEKKPFCVTHDWLQANCPGFIEKNEWPLNSSALNPTDHHVRDAMLEKYRILQPKPKKTDELEVALRTILEELPQENINKAVANFTKHLT